MVLGQGSGAPRGGSRRTGGREPVEASLAVAGLTAALELLGAPAFLLDDAGAVLCANPGGRDLHGRDPRALANAFASARGERAGTPLALTQVRAPGHGPHWLAVWRDDRARHAERACAAAQRWKLTRRQTDVVAEVAQGRSNRQIARALGCAESTVELHVSALLAKAGCRSRAALVARFWTER
jgi:DNA-binding NarL/FixJ family response regulator